LRAGTAGVQGYARSALAALGPSLPAQLLLATVRDVAQAGRMWPEAAKALGERAPVAYLLGFLDGDDGTLADAALAALMTVTTALSDEEIDGPVRVAMLRTLRASPGRLRHPICDGMTALGERAPADVVVELAAVSDGLTHERAYNLLAILGTQAVEPALQLLA